MRDMDTNLPLFGFGIEAMNIEQRACITVNELGGSDSQSSVSGHCGVGVVGSKFRPEVIRNRGSIALTRKRNSGITT